MSRFIKLKVVIPIVLGIIIGGLLFALGDMDDAPGMSAIGISIGFIFIMFGINKSGLIKRGWFAPILLIFFSIFISLITTSILLDGEFGDKPLYSIYGYLISLILLLIGILRIRLIDKKVKH